MAAFLVAFIIGYAGYIHYQVLENEYQIKILDETLRQHNITRIESTTEEVRNSTLERPEFPKVIYEGVTGYLKKVLLKNRYSEITFQRICK